MGWVSYREDIEDQRSENTYDHKHSGNLSGNGEDIQSGDATVSKLFWQRDFKWKSTNPITITKDQLKNIRLYTAVGASNRREAPVIREHTRRK